MNSVAAILGPLIAAQSLAWGSERGFNGMAFLIAGLLMSAAALIIALGTPRPAAARPAAETP